MRVVVKRPRFKSPSEKRTTKNWGAKMSVANDTDVAVGPDSWALPDLSDTKIGIFCEIAERCAQLGPWCGFDYEDLAADTGQSSYFCRATVETFKRKGLIETLGASPQLAIRITARGRLLVAETLGDVWHDRLAAQDVGAGL